jgi:hypothetical protein
VVVACQEHAKKARALARELLVRADEAPAVKSARVAEQVRERRLARASCSLAAVRVQARSSTEAAGDAQSELDAVREANDLWANVPTADAGP